jgi:FkbH-like protein
MSSSAFSLTDLPWLPRLSGDFRSRLQSIAEGAGSDWGFELRTLATQFLGLNQAIAIARALDVLRTRSPSPSLSRLRLGLVSNGTVDFLKPFLAASALRHGISLEIVAADFGQVMQEAMDPGSLINRAKPDAILLAVDHRGLPFRSGDGPRWPPFDHQAAFDQLTAACEAFQKHSGATCLVQTLPAPPQLLFGSLDIGLAGTLRTSVARFNALLASSIATRGEVLVDVDWLAQSVGLDNWYDDRYWYLARLPFAQRALPLYADFVARVLAAMRGKSRKCLVLDLDNTLWGGVIGDDGLDGIVLAVGDARGEAYRAVQTAAADLRKRGVILAVCSKNDDSAAREPFRSHPGMVLKEQDVAVFVANWDDKATNIERIAKRLELGLDALVLLDDNPVERALVRGALPEVAVPELGDDPSTFARVLLAAGYFESVAFTPEDLARADQYKENASRSELLEKSRNLEDFLRSLEMQIEFAPFDATGRRRIAQLINKTNQFNVTTRRYTERQVASFETSPDHYTLQVSVRDRFGDNGVIGIVICDIRPDAWQIDTWLMSCRVLNRRIEEAICNRIAADAKRAGAGSVIGVFVPTERNSIASDLFRRLGFDPFADAQGGTRWVLDLERFVPFDVPLAERRELLPAN